MDALLSSGRGWKWCALVSLAMVLLSLIPQFHLWIVRGREWNGTYVQIQGDEPLYAAYINALLHGRTRRNDPYGAKDDSQSTPLPESTFSIQLIPPYVITFLARLFDASASTAMIILLGVAGFLASLALCWLLNSLTGDYRIAAAGTLFVLCLGGLAGGHALLGLIIKVGDLSMPSLPFLRRYQPAGSFPLLILFIGLVWHALTNESKSRGSVAALLAGLAFALLIFSYLYLWTAAAAWVVCLSVLWFWLKPNARRKLVSSLITIGAITALALVPYAYLVSHRSPSLDEQQTLAFSHQPDLLRIPEILGLLVLIALFVAIRRRKIERTDSRFVFTASLAVLPLVVFNQQVLTGRTMQPYHFAAFVVNYTVLIAVLITTTLWWKTISNRLLVWLAVLSFLWGFVEVALPAQLTTVPAAIMNDQTVPVLVRLNELSKHDGTLSDLHTKGSASTIVFSPQLIVSVLLPAWTSQGTLLDIGGLDFGGVTREQRKEYFYMHLYYAKANTEELRKALKGMPEDPTMNYYARAVIFGHERIVPALSAEFKPIQDEEVEREIRAYHAYADSFSHTQAVKRPLTYAIILSDSNFDFSHVDRWYERDAGEPVGSYTLYRLKLRE